MRCIRHFSPISSEQQSSELEILTTTIHQFSLQSFFIKMPAYSTMQPLPNDAYHRSFDETVLQSPITRKAIPTHNNTDFESSPVLLVGPSSMPVSFTGRPNHTGFHGDTHHDGAAKDGETVWYCCSCGDGEVGTWQPGCPNCGHNRCGYCCVEEV